MHYFYVIGKCFITQKPSGGHTVAYNVDVANCDRRRREFRGRNSIVYTRKLSKERIDTDENIQNYFRFNWQNSTT